MHIRLVIQPIVAIVLAIRAGLKDCREGQPAYFWAVLRNSADRGRLFRSGWKDIGRVVIVALVLDTVYQLIVLRWWYPVQAFIVAAALAVVPYVLFRGPINRVARRVKKRSSSAQGSKGGKGVPTARCESLSRRDANVQRCAPLHQHGRVVQLPACSPVAREHPCGSYSCWMIHRTLPETGSCDSGLCRDLLIGYCSVERKFRKLEIGA
jgi:hypothetical protein